MIRANRADFLRRLESVQSGITAKEGQIQSNCLVFRNGLVQTYNGEVAATFESGIGNEMTGAVQATKLLNFLQKLSGEEVEIYDDSASELKIKCGTESAGFPLEKEILLPIDSVEQGTEWHELPQGFLEALGIVMQCTAAETAKTAFITTVINITSKWLEACDGVQVIRYRIPTPVSRPILVRQSAIKNVVALGVTEFSETSSWTHFRNAEGLTYSCRCFLDPYPSDDITRVLKSEDGEMAVLPKGLTDIAARAMIFAEQAKVFVELDEDRLRIKGKGAGGEWYNSGRIKVAYHGPELKFLISPKLFGELAAKNNEIYISAELLKIKGGNGAWKYATVLGISEDGPAEQPQEPAAEPAEELVSEEITE